MSIPPLLRDKNLWLTFGITLTVVMGVSSIIPILPLLIKALDIPESAVSFVITAFTVPGIIFTPIAGILADRYGRKKVLIPSLLLFALAGGACGFAKTLHTLLTLRALQGVGAASLGVLYVTIVNDLYDGPTRVKAMAYNAGALSLGTAIYPAIGGALGELGWNVPFFIPFASLPLIYLVWRTLHLPKPDASQSMRAYFKQALQAMKTTQAIALFSISFLTFSLLYGPVITCIPILAAKRFAVSSLHIGGLFALTSLGTLLVTMRMGSSTEHIKPHRLMLSGHIMYIVAMLLIPLMPSFWWLLLPVLFFGLAQGLNTPPLMTLLGSLAPLEQRAAIMAINGMVLRTAQTVAPLVIMGIYSFSGFTGVYASSCLLALCMFIISTCAIR